MLEEVERSLDEYKMTLELKEKQLSDCKKLLLSAKKSYNKKVDGNKELKRYITNITKRFAQYQQQQQTQFLEQQKYYYVQKSQKNK